MKHKFTLLFLFCLISLKLDASISFNQTEFGIQIYLENNAPSLLNIPKSGVEFIQIALVQHDIKEKLGSYQVEQIMQSQSKNFKVVDAFAVSDNAINILFTLEFRKQTYEGELLINGTINPESPIQKISLSSKVYTKEEFNVFTYNISKDFQAVFGGGIQFSHCNLAGQKIPLIVEENGVGRGDKGPTFWANLLGAAGNEHTTYAPMANFITNDNVRYDCNSFTPESYWEVDFTSSNKLSFQFNNLSPTIPTRARINISYSKEKTSEESKKVQAMPYPELEDWMYQYILGIQGGKDKVNAMLKRMQANNIKVGAIWIQDWVGKRQTSIGSRLQWDWHANEEVYPNIKQWIDSLHQEDIKVLGYINPYFVEGGQQAIEGLDNGYFVKTDKEEAYKFKAGGFNAYMIDLNNKDAYRWMESIIKVNLIQNGFDGWMCDFGEWFPMQDFSRSNAVPFSHNHFPKAWVLLNQNLNTQQDLFIFNRSWYGNNNQYPPIMWLGDQMGNFGKHDGLGSAVNAYNSASLSGFPLVHSDIGGYTAIKLGPIKDLRDDEILQRWIEMECFTPLWRSHEGLKPDDMSQIYQDENMLGFFAYFDSIHNSLIPYFKTLNKICNKTGQPFVQHPFLLYPNDQNTYDLQYQFFVGEELLVCPVIEEGATQVKAYLPEGKWRHFFTQEVYNGGSWQEFEAPIGRPAVFWKVD